MVRSVVKKQSKALYQKQRNYIVNLNRKAKRKHFSDLGTTPNFWKSAKPYFSKKTQNHEKIFLLDDSNKLIDNEASIAKKF